jgi:hypothetical protein
MNLRAAVASPRCRSHPYLESANRRIKERAASEVSRRRRVQLFPRTRRLPSEPGVSADAGPPHTARLRVVPARPGDLNPPILRDETRGQCELRSVLQHDSLSSTKAKRALLRAALIKRREDIRRVGDGTRRRRRAGNTGSGIWRKQRASVTPWLVCSWSPVGWTPRGCAAREKHGIGRQRAALGS